nr:glycosyltransferase family 1 protein [uncultured Erwinia sp.]
MKIKYDASWFGMGGIGRFSEEIEKRLKKNYSLKNFSISGNPASPLATLKLTFKMCIDRESFFLLPGYIPPIGQRGRFIFTIHDLNHLDIPDNSGLLKKLFYKYIIKTGCKNAYKILTVSNFSKEKIVEWSGVDPSKVIVAGNGVGENYHPNIKHTTNNEKYYLCVSNRKSHKNEKRMLEAFSQAKIDEKINLVMTGKDNEEINRLILSLNLKDRVKFTGFLTENELVEFYRNSHALLFPSLYEGFGIPVLEAMASGVPVITSNTTSLPEVAGDAALFVDPTSVEEIKLAIEKLEIDEGVRQSLIYKGFLQIKKFSWDNVVDIIKDEIRMKERSIKSQIE